MSWPFHYVCAIFHVVLCVISFVVAIICVCSLFSLFLLLPLPLPLLFSVNTHNFFSTFMLFDYIYLRIKKCECAFYIEFHFLWRYDLCIFCWVWFLFADNVEYVLICLVNFRSSFLNLLILHCLAHINGSNSHGSKFVQKSFDW